jgi:hypothetical protein
MSLLNDQGIEKFIDEMEKRWKKTVVPQLIACVQIKGFELVYVTIVAAAP